MTRNKRVTVHVRWGVMRDLPRVVGIEAASGGDWTRERFVEELRRRDTVVMVADVRGNVAGFVVYRLCGRPAEWEGGSAFSPRGRIEVEKLAVAPAHRGRGVGSALLARMVAKTAAHRREFLTLPAGGSGWAVRADPQWATSDVRFLTGGDRAPPLEVLADALQEAGCGDETLLALFRRGGRLAEVVYAALKPVLAGGTGYGPEREGW